MLAVRACGEILRIVVRLLEARRSEMHDDGRQGRSLAGTALVQTSPLGVNAGVNPGD